MEEQENKKALKQELQVGHTLKLWSKFILNLEHKIICLRDPVPVIYGVSVHMIYFYESKFQFITEAYVISGRQTLYCAILTVTFQRQS